MDVQELKSRGFDGEVYDSETYRLMYATDASIYRELPTAVVFPKHVQDIQVVVNYCNEKKLSIIPRGAGTSLAGQCVGSGIVMDVSKYMHDIIEINEEEGYVIVEPGLVRDELNLALEDTDWIFGPNTSTSNRATIGGMVGNNSSGTTSVAFGVTRDKVLSLEVVLSDGTHCEFSDEGFFAIDDEPSTILNELTTYLDKYTGVEKLLNEIKIAYPDPRIHRRNTGYALDFLFDSTNDPKSNWYKLLCGSEGTLCLVTKIKLKLDKKPPPHVVVVVSHFTSIDAALRHVPHILSAQGVFMLELMDDAILECAKQSVSQKDNLFFIKGTPKALLMTEVRANSAEELKTRIRTMSAFGESSPDLYVETVVEAKDISRVWTLRAAGLGVMSNIPGDEMALACIEDTAVHPSLLADYIAAFSSIMKSHKQKAIYYAHAGAGEIHLRPILNLKTESGRADFRSICQASAALVKKYNGSLSGEHGDGRVRAPFIKEFYGDIIYTNFIELKAAFDPNNIFNPGKIVGAKDLLDDIRYELNGSNQLTKSAFLFAPDESILHHAERCNGSGDCRKSHALSPGMCPTYQATKLEIHTTRARANLMRESLMHAKDDFDAGQSAHESMSSCLACKACKSECPSGVDVALLKSEYMHKQKLQKGSRLRDYLLGHPTLLYRLNKYLPLPSRFINSGGLKWVFKLLGFAQERSFPLPARKSVVDLLQDSAQSNHSVTRKTNVALAVDEFVNYFDLSAGLSTYNFLIKAGYEVTLFEYNSGRALISKGYLDEAAVLAKSNIELFYNQLQIVDAIVGIEPSALLSLRDEYCRFSSTVGDSRLDDVKTNSYLFSEFLIKEMNAGEFDLSDFNFKPNIQILQHVHCHQRALADVPAVMQLFNSIPTWMCEQINTGCCGMAGGFGYEAEHYELSQQVASLGLYPAINANPDHYIVASGMSCRHQIRDGVMRKARHPAELLMKFME